MVNIKQTSEIETKRLKIDTKYRLNNFKLEFEIDSPMR
jgi:hypothetical protein